MAKRKRTNNDLQNTKVQIKFAKALLGVNKQAVNLAVLGELGMYPISIHAFKSAIEFWLQIFICVNCFIKVLSISKNK
jgi:hypothetical protein